MMSDLGGTMWISVFLLSVIIQGYRGEYISESMTRKMMVVMMMMMIIKVMMVMAMMMTIYGGNSDDDLILIMLKMVKMITVV